MRSGALSLLVLYRLGEDEAHGGGDGQSAGFRVGLQAETELVVGLQVQLPGHQWAGPYVLISSMR